MVNRTGLHTAPVPGTPPVGTAPIDGRLVQAALFGSAGQCLNGGGYSASSSTMAFTWAAGVYQIPDTANGGAVYHSPIDSAVLTPSAGVAGGRIDSIYVLQQDFEKNGTTSTVVYGLQPGTAGSGTAPSLSGIAGGPMRIANITVPASATKATDCTVAWVVPPATLAQDGPVVANATLLALIPGTYVGQRASVAGIDYRWSGSIWEPWDCDWMAASFGVGGVNGAYGASPGWTTSDARYRYVSGLVRYRGNFSLNGPAAAATSQLTFSLPVNASTAVGARLSGKISGFNSSDSNSEWDLGYGFSATTVFLGQAQGSGGKYGPAAFGSVPFGEAWAVSDSVSWDFTYDPA